jgi:hypothetical protein
VSSGGWFTTASLSRRIFQDTEVPSERISEAAVKLHRSWSKQDLTLVFTVAERTRAGVQSVNESIQATAIRRF